MNIVNESIAIVIETVRHCAFARVCPDVGSKILMNDINAFIDHADYDSGTTETGLRSIRASFDGVPSLGCADLREPIKFVAQETRVVWRRIQMQNVIRLSVENIRLPLQRCNCRHGVFRSNVSKAQAGNDVGSVESFEFNGKLTTVKADQPLEGFLFGQPFAAIANQHLTRNKLWPRWFLAVI